MDQLSESDEKMIDDLAKGFTKSPPQADWNYFSEETRNVLRAGMRVVLSIVRTKDKTAQDKEAKRLAREKRNQNDFESFRAFHAGFSLSAQRREDGKLYPYGEGEPMDEWPEEIKLFGNVFGLEEVIKGENGFEEGSYA